MIQTLIDVFRQPSVERLLQQQLDDAKRNAVMHEAAAEHHEALALMYRSRAERLGAQIQTKQPAERSVWISHSAA